MGADCVAAGGVARRAGVAGAVALARGTGRDGGVGVATRALRRVLFLAVGRVFDA